MLSIEEMNDGFVQLSGYTAEDMEHCFKNRLPPCIYEEDLSVFQSLQAGIAQGKIYATAEYRITGKDTEIRWYRLLASHSLTIRESPPAPSGLSSTLMMAGDAQQEADGPAQSENLFRRSNLSGNKKSAAPLFVAIFKFFCYNYCTSILLCM